MNAKFLNKIIYFQQGTGCIPPDAICYCYAIEGEYLLVNFRHAVLNRYDLKIHIDVANKHGRIM